MQKSLQSVFLLFMLSKSLLAQKSEVYISDGKAINGYDAVAYFTNAGAIPGSETFVYTWNGSKWFFSSGKNLQAFKLNPQKYAPQYGGYCAYGMSGGYKAPTDPHAWTIVNNKLYLNYNQDVKKMWVGNQSQHIANADKNWPKLKNRE